MANESRVNQSILVEEPFAKLSDFVPANGKRFETLSTQSGEGKNADLRTT